MPVSIWLTSTIKKFEGLDYYDYGISYNPMSVFSTKDVGVNKYVIK